MENKYLFFSNNYSKNNSSKIFNNIKRTLKYQIYKYLKKNITNINSLYINGSLKFGNYFIALNNAILFCEILNCKKIIINNNRKGFINDRIFYQKYNITIDSNYSFNCHDNNSIIANVKFCLYNINFTDLGKINRFYVLRKEIINNLPKVKINSNDLYIYIRGGDIFRRLNKSHPYYSQPPLCFYSKILVEFNFRKVVIISEDTGNPVIPILLKENSYIKFNKNSIKLDISYLANSFNIVSSTSSFIISIIFYGNMIFISYQKNIYFYIIQFIPFHLIILFIK